MGSDTKSYKLKRAVIEGGNRFEAGSKIDLTPARAKQLGPKFVTLKKESAGSNKGKAKKGKSTKKKK